MEFQRFLRGPAWPVFTRLTSEAPSSDDRLVEYMEQMPRALASFDTMPLAAFGFACTGSSYLLGDEREEEITNSVLQKHRCHIVTATQAIRRELEGRGASRIALLAPYPKPLVDAASAYWVRFGFDVVATARVDIGEDTRAIYEITDANVAEALTGFDAADADVTVLSGTGMPTITALLNADRPMLSSNLCLATELLRRTQQWPPNEAADIGKLCSGRR